MTFPYHHQQQQPESLPQYAGQDSHHHHHHHQVVLPQSQSGGSSSQQYSSSNNHHLVAAQQRQQQQQNNNNNNSNDQLQQLAELANKMIHKIDTSMMLNPYKEDKKLQMEAEANIQDNLLEYALPFLKMFLGCYNEYVNLGQFQGRGFFDSFSSIIDRLAVMNNQQSGEYDQHQTILGNYYNENKIKLNRAQDQPSGLLVALGRSCFIVEQALRWKSTQLYVLPANVLQNFLDNADSFIKQEFSFKRGEHVFFEEKYGSVTSDDRQRIERIIEETKYSNNFDVIKQLFTLVCTNRTVDSVQLKLPVHFTSHFISIINILFHFIDPMPLRMYYIETTCITFDEQYHQVQVDPRKSIPQFSFHVHLQSTFNLVDGLFLLLESSVARSCSNFICLSFCFNALKTFAKFCTAPTVSKTLLQVTDDPRNNIINSNINHHQQKILTKNRLLQLAHYLYHFVAQRDDRSCLRLAHQVFELLSFVIWKCSVGVFRKTVDVQTLLSLGLQSPELLVHQFHRPSFVQHYQYSVDTTLREIKDLCQRDQYFFQHFDWRCTALENRITNGRNAMILKRALSSASKDDSEGINGETDAVEEASSEINELEEALFKNMRENFDTDFARAPSSQDANEDDSSSNNNKHPAPPAPPAPLPPSDDDHKIDRITPVSPSSQQPQQNLPAVNLPAPAARSQQATPVFGTSLHLYVSKQLLLKFISCDVSATSNHFKVLYDKCINDQETKINVSRQLYLKEYKAVKCILHHFPLMNSDEQKDFKDLLEDCHDDPNAPRDEIDRDFDKKYHRNHVKYNPDGSISKEYKKDHNLFKATSTPSILKKVSNYNNIQQDPTGILHPDGTFRFKKDFSFFEKIPKKVNNNNKRCRWKKVVAADFAGETDVAFGRWIEQRCTAPDISLLDYADSPGFIFEEKLESGFTHYKNKNKDSSDNNNNDDNAAYAYQQYYGSSSLGGHHVKNKNNNNNNQTNEMMSGQRRERDNNNNNNQTNKNKKYDNDEWETSCRRNE